MLKMGVRVKHRIDAGILMTLLLVGMLTLASNIQAVQASAHIARYAIEFEESSFNGYTLFAPMKSTTTYLINNSGEVVHTWVSDYRPGLSVYLLENGNLLRTAYPGGEAGARVQEIEWNGTVIWDFECSSDQHRRHHDVEALPNGNVLMIAWEVKTATEAIAAGRNPDMLSAGELWPDHVIEVEPNGATGGNIVWEWHVWDHLIQDYDSSKENYGVVADHPELVDINFPSSGPGSRKADWNHMNSIAYNEEFDQIMLSVNTFNEFWVIDHSTTTEEAAGHTGGNSGKGGDILYRWGNPQAYRAGDASDQKFFHLHDAQWVESGPGEGNILVFNNGFNRPAGLYSSVDEIMPPVDESGNYSLTSGSAYGPEEQTWIYTAENPLDFYSPNISGVQRLPNGNTLICSGANGYFFEVTQEKETVWEYINPFPDSVSNNVFKVRRYAPDFPGLVDLIPQAGNDVAVTAVTTDRTIVGQGYNCHIDVTVENQGNSTETFNVTAYYSNETLTPGQWETFWSLGDVNRDGYIDDTDGDLISAALGSTPGDPNWNPDADLNQDDAINVSDSTIWLSSYGKDIWTEFNILEGSIGRQTFADLSPGDSATLVFSWDTTGILYGDYIISARATRVPGEADITNNAYDDGWVRATIPGDVDGDRTVGVSDLATLTEGYGSTPTSPNWNPNADIDNDGVVDIFDIGLTSDHWGESW